MSEPKGDETATARLERLGIRLPPPPRPSAGYQPCTRNGDLLFIAGQVPFVDGALAATGRVGAELDLAESARCARIAALNALAIAAAEVGSPDPLKMVNLVIYVASAPGYFDQHLTADGASAVLIEVLGDFGKHARTAVAVPALPLNSPVEVQALFAVGRAPRR